MKKLLFLFLLLITSLFSYSQIIINEYSCSNFKKEKDNFNKAEDWFELYNTGASSVDISGYHVSDKLTKPMKWTFPVGTIIPSNGILLIWASDRDTVVNNLHYHTNFKLTQSGIPDVIIFSDPTGVILDNLTINKTQKNHQDF